MREFYDPQTGEIVQLQNEHGWEIPDPTPAAMPAGMKKPETLAETVRRLVRAEKFQQEMAAAGNETFEDSEDFDVDDDFDPSTPYEEMFDPFLGKAITPEEFQRHHATYEKRYLKAQEEYYARVDAEGIMGENLARARYREKQAAKMGGEGGNPPSQAKPVAQKPA